MKRKYSLDYSIQRDCQRVAAIADILDTLQTDPTPAQLQQMGSYILYGKDENGLNAAKRGEIMTNNTRYQSYRKKEDKNMSLDELLDKPTADQQSLRDMTQKRTYTVPKQTIARPRYSKSGELIDPGDSDIPGMTDLWDSIDRLERTIATYKGQLAPTEDTPQLNSDYRLYQLKHWLIDLRRHQYYLKDSYKPALHFLALDRPRAQYIDWSQDCAYWMTFQQWQDRVDNALLHTISQNIDDYQSKVTPTGVFVKWVVRQHTFDWEDPVQVAALINNYDLLYDTFRDKINTYGRTFIFDFQRYRALANLNEVQEFLLTRKIQHIPYYLVLEELEKRFGITYNENHMSFIMARTIPKLIATAAKKARILAQTPPQQLKTCYRCKKQLPRTTLFFSRNASRKDGFSSNCKDCDKQRRIEKGGQTIYDRRRKDNPQMPAVQASQTNK